MRPSKPPVVATWLLKHFVPDPQDEIIAGDLLEHFHEGRSRWWYWRQVMVAIARPSGLTVMSVVRVLLVGWLMELNVVPLLVRIAFLTPPITDANVYAATFVAGIVTGGLLSLLNRPNHLAPMFLFAASFFGRDLYRLLIWPGIQMTPSHGTPALYYITWLLWTWLDAVFVVGVLAPGVVLAYRAHSVPLKLKT